MFKLTRVNLSIFVLWLFVISGIIGILSSQKDWFLANTPINLYLYFIIIFINLKKINTQVFITLLIPFLLGFVSEGLGVNYGYIFGSYSYGENLGYKVWNVPITICFNWVVLTVITNDFISRFVKSKLIITVLASFLMVLIDLSIEVSAPRFDYWEFKDGLVPIQNYIGWFAIGLLAQLGFTYFKIETNKKISLHLLLVIILFFGTFLFY